MNKEKYSESDFFCSFLLGLYHDSATGIIKVNNDKRSISLYINNGHIVYADGLDDESSLLREIASKKALEQEMIDDLNGIRREDPDSLGSTLIERRLVSQSVWKKFLTLKIKHILSTVFHMENCKYSFSESELLIPPINSLDYNIIQLMLETLRDLKGMDFFEKHISEGSEVFTQSDDLDDFLPDIPFTPSEDSVLSLVDGVNNVSELVKASGLDIEAVYRALYLLLSFGRIIRSGDEGKEKDTQSDFTGIISLYLDLLRILETYFRKEAGTQFDTIFSSCRDELPEENKQILQGLDLSKDSQKVVLQEILFYLPKQDSQAEKRILIFSSFNKLLFLLFLRMKKVLGTGLTEKTLNDMMDMLKYLGKYGKDVSVIDYLEKNLEGYLTRIRK